MKVPLLPNVAIHNILSFTPIPNAAARVEKSWNQEAQSVSRKNSLALHPEWADIPNAYKCYVQLIKHFKKYKLPDHVARKLKKENFSDCASEEILDLLKQYLEGNWNEKFSMSESEFYSIRDDLSYILRLIVKDSKEMAYFFIKTSLFKNNLESTVSRIYRTPPGFLIVDIVIGCIIFLFQNLFGCYPTDNILLKHKPCINVKPLATYSKYNIPSYSFDSWHRFYFRKIF